VKPFESYSLNNYENSSQGQRSMSNGTNFQASLAFTTMGNIHTKLHQFLISGFWDFVRKGRHTDRHTEKRRRKQFLLVACMQVMMLMTESAAVKLWVMFREEQDCHPVSQAPLDCGRTRKCIRRNLETAKDDRHQSLVLASDGTSGWQLQSDRWQHRTVRRGRGRSTLDVWPTDW